MEIKIVKQVMEWNENCNDELKALLKEKKVLMINIMGSPGAGKTTLIEGLIKRLKENFNIGVIEADIASSIDAERIKSLGIPVVQLNTDGACHIEAMSIKNILPYFDLDKLQIMFVENIGNLVCPAEFDIGEDLKVAVLSVPEGDDKIEKYPLMFERANALIINKWDVKNYFKFNFEHVFKKLEDSNNNIKVFQTNSVSGDGIKELSLWIEEKAKNKLV